MNGKILVDTNVLIYATLSNDPRYKTANKVLELRHHRKNKLFISAQNLSEMYPNLTGPKTQPSDSPTIARQKITTLASLDHCVVLPVTDIVVQKALELCVKYHVTKQKFFDMQLVALMLLENIPVIVTENISDFSFIKGIKAINPFE
jgi:predicted nucleic acid-binding protein